MIQALRVGLNPSRISENPEEREHKFSNKIGISLCFFRIGGLGNPVLIHHGTFNRKNSFLRAVFCTQNRVASIVSRV